MAKKQGMVKPVMYKCVKQNWLDCRISYLSYHTIHKVAKQRKLANIKMQCIQNTKYVKNINIGSGGGKQKCNTSFSLYVHVILFDRTECKHCSISQGHT